MLDIYILTLYQKSIVFIIMNVDLGLYFMHETLNYYENNSRSLAKQYESAKVDNIHSLLLKTFPANSHLLEIGCGSGRDANFLHNNGYDIIAIDGSKEMIAEAKRCHPELTGKLKTVIIPDQLHFELSSFDGVYSIATLMHLDKDEINQTLEKIAMILKTNGKFLFSVSLQRGDVDDQGKDKKGRYFTSMSELGWVSCCERYKLKLKHSEIMGDGLDRDDIAWLTCIVEKGE